MCMVRSHDLVVWFKQIDKDDSKYVGGKCANLGEMIQAKFPVPDGFALTTRAYFEFIRENNLDVKIKHLLGTVNFNDSNSLAQVSRHIRNIINTSVVPEEIVKQVFSYYEQMGSPLVAIRSSATSEDSKTASFAGQQETYLNVKGESAVIENIRAAWASLFEARAIYYRHEQKLDDLKVGISLAIQRMVESEVSGVMFTIDPITSDKSKIIIEAIWGLGEYIVQGKVTPDHYEINKQNLDLLLKAKGAQASIPILKQVIAEQTIMLKKYQTGNKEEKVPLLKKKKQKITEPEMLELARLGLALEKHYYFPQDVEWAREKGILYIVQTRPITTVGNLSTVVNTKKEGAHMLSSHDHPILMGDPASPGMGIGVVRILKSAHEIGKVKQGDVLVAPYTSPDYVPAMKKSSAIITESGGRTSHAAIVSREFGIPAVVGVKNVTNLLHEGEVVTVNGRTGEIYKGSIIIKEDKPKSIATTVKTHTRLYVNLAEPELADTVASRNVDGVGLLRAEFMIAQIGTHPRKLIKDGREKLFIQKLAEGLEKMARPFYPRPIIYRTTDFKTNEYRGLKGGKDYEPVESNPMLGYRGAYRYIHDARVFKLELEAIKYVREKKGLTNLHVMIPFVRTPEELILVKRIMNENNLRRTQTFKLFMMCEIPSNVILIDEFIKVGIDGVSIGSNDLTMLVLGTDRDNDEVAHEFDERNPAVMWALERVITSCKKNNVSVSICGQAPSVYPELVEKLVEWGITSISVSPDAIDNTRNTIYNVEKKFLHL